MYIIGINTIITIANIGRLYFTLGFAANLYGTENNFVWMPILDYGDDCRVGNTK